MEGKANNVRSEERNPGKIPFLSFYRNQKGETYEEENGCGIACSRSGDISGGLWGCIRNREHCVNEDGE